MNGQFLAITVASAGAVVTKSFPAGSVIAGVPAKLIRSTADQKLACPAP
jgi:acetyltransferase-like isoleucine patch superfamily enzyme